MDKEKTPAPDLETKLDIVDGWIEIISTNDLMQPIDRKVLADVLKECGADFTPLTEFTRFRLAKYKNSERALSMRKVWSKGRYDEFVIWTKKYASDYEKEKGVKVPVIKQESKKELGKVLIFKNSGMLQFFGTITALASLPEDEYPFEEAKRLTEVRARNGRAWAKGRKDDLERVFIPTSKSEILPSSFPPGFPKDCWELIKSWRK